jgi:hypothetical protein
LRRLILRCSGWPGGRRKEAGALSYELADRTVHAQVCEVRRLEVITGALGRRRWSAEAQGVDRGREPGAGVVISEVPRRQDLLPQQLFAWRY